MFSPIFIDLVLFVLFLLVVRLILFYLFVGKGGSTTLNCDRQ
jgi:hypothetical protein